MRRGHNRHLSGRKKSWMVGIFCGAVATLGLARVLAEPVGRIGAADRLVVRGLQQINPEQLRQSLIDDADLIWLSRPHADRERFVSAFVRKATLAVERAGFASPDVQAAIESSDGVERLVLTVTEGPRFEAGAVKVTGVDDELAARLVRQLTERMSSHDSDDPHDPHDPPDPPLWLAGSPAPCDAVAVHEIRIAVARFLRDEGYLSIAPVINRRMSARLPGGGSLTTRSTQIDTAGTQAGFDVSISLGDRSADLIIAIHDLPPKGVLRGIELPADCRTSDRDLMQYLGIEIDAAVTERDRLAWRERLRQSGRFVRHEIDFYADPEDPAAVVARFDFEEYRAATPLSQPLSREEATMLRCRDWLVKAMNRGDDFVIDVARSQAKVAQIVISATNGFLLAAMPNGDQSCGLAVSGTAVSLLPAGGAGRLDMPLPTFGRLTATLGLSLVRDRASTASASRYNPSLTMGYSFKSGNKNAPTAFVAKLQFEPVACLAMVHEGSPNVRFEGETLVIESASAASRIDSVSGRPLRLSVSGCELSIDARRAALDGELDRLRAVAGPNIAQPDQLITSAIKFLLSGDVAAACGRIADAADFADDARAGWESRLLQTIVAVQQCLDDGGLSERDSLLPAASEVSNPVKQVEPLQIPSEDDPTTAAAVHKALTRQVAAIIWRFTEEHCGRNSWPAALVSAGACGLVGDAALLDELTEFMADDDYGPLAHVVAASFTPVPLVAMSLARRGQDRLSTVAFHTDCHPLLVVADAYGLDECLVSILRAIDDDTARKIGQIVCGVPEILLPLLHGLQAHSNREDAVAGLQAALDVWWAEGLRALVAARLAAVATPRTAAAPGTGNAPPVKK